MSDLGEALAQVRTGNWDAALSLLLAAWREKRAVRLAEVIDRVSERIVAERGVVGGKTIRGRSEAWLAIAKKKEPADLGRLLATPWPGRWQDCVPLINAYLEYPDDPRFAVPFARMVHDGPFVSWASLLVYRSCIALVVKAGDLRALPILEAALARETTREWNMRVRAEVVAGVEALQKHVEPEQPASLDALEAFFATATQTKTTTAKSDVEFMAAIYAAPDDDSLRAVYADWLTEQGHPRGEFIALQLMPNPTPAAEKRMGTLLHKYGKVWAGELERLLWRDDRVFSRGFLAGGFIKNLSYKAPLLAQQLAAPEWALFERLTVGYASPRILFDQPWTKNLRVVLGVEPLLADVLTRGGHPRIEELHLLLGNEDAHSAEVQERIADGKALPSLKRLGLEASAETVAEFIKGPFPKRLERLWISNADLPIQAVVDALRAAKRSVGTIEITSSFSNGRGFSHIAERSGGGAEG